MKKLFLTLVLAFTGIFAANAQLWMGGSVGAAFVKNYSTFSIAPEVGYSFNEKWAVGLQLGFTTQNGVINADGTTATVKKAEKSSTVFSFAPYARYTFAKTGIASFFLDGGVGFSFYNNEGGSQIGIGVRPGVKLAASEKVDFVAKLGYLGYQWGNEKHGKDSQFGIGVNNTAVEFGVFYNF